MRIRAILNISSLSELDKLNVESIEIIDSLAPEKNPEISSGNAEISARVEQVVQILRRVREYYNGDKESDIQKLIRSAINEFADERNIKYSSVSAKLSVQQRLTMGEFTRKVEKWLLEDNEDELREVILKNSVKPADKVFIKKFFNS